jgi:probable addiction module antidote protein
MRYVQGLVTNKTQGWPESQDDLAPFCCEHMMKEQFSRFDAAEFLTDETTIARYLSAALDDANTDVFIAALSDVARARGITQMAKTAGVGRESLYKTLAPGSKPRYETIRKLLDTLGVKLMVVPGQASTTAA